MAAAAEAGLGMDGLAKYDALSQQIKVSFVEFHSLLDTQKCLLLERVRQMRELYQKHRDIEKSIEQMEGMKRAANEMVTESIIAGSKKQMVCLFENNIFDLRIKKAMLDSVSEFKFLSNADEFHDCVNRILLRDSTSLEFNKRREPVLMKCWRGEEEIECTICCENYTANEMIQMFFCNHMFCKECVKDNFTHVVRNAAIKKWTCPECGKPDIQQMEDPFDYFGWLSNIVQVLCDHEIADLFHQKVNEFYLSKRAEFR